MLAFFSLQIFGGLLLFRGLKKFILSFELFRVFYVIGLLQFYLMARWRKLTYKQEKL